ncbi:MAG: HAD family hydrolase, partial [Bacteroidetes bacterium]|nr:HAD family hydrolase [Bacteroidota bacterium]
MINNPHKILDELKPSKEFFIGIDSDGCVFDTMEIKHKECFCPAYIKYFGLQKISKYARESWDFVNLYSKTRGANRFKALVRSINLLKNRKEVRAREAELPDLTPIIDWMGKETKLGNPALQKFASEVNNPIVDKTLEWSKEVNYVIEQMVHNIPPFPFFNETLMKMVKRADTIVVSQTPLEALVREWKEHGIDKYVKLICGQEYGTKAEHLKYSAVRKYHPDKILMIGDAPGDLDAAKSNGALFYPVNPGHEEKSWERFYTESLDKFL